MRSSFPVAHGLAAVAGLLGVANAQGLYGTPAGQVGFSTCSAFPIRYLGCFATNSAALDVFAPFIPAVYTPPTSLNPLTGLTPNSSPNFDPGTSFDNTVTPADCSSTCRSFGYKYTIILANVCRCAMQIPATGLGTSTSGACNVPCGGDSSQSCGGTTSADLYVDPSFADQIPIQAANNDLVGSYRYLGCYRTDGFTNGPDTRLALTANNGLFTSVSDCYARCAGLGYPLGYAVRQPTGLNNIECRCGTAFNLNSYRLRGPEYYTNVGDCTVNCGSGALNCDPRFSLCCGAPGGGSYPVYINPELQGCYSPVIPGIKDGDRDPTFDCYDVPVDLLGPPKTLALAQAVIPPQTLNVATKQALIRQPSVASSAGTYYLYGCVQPGPLGIVGGLLTAAAAGPIFPAPASLEACAAACANSVISLPFMAISPTGQCYCGSGTLTASPPLVAAGASACNVPCPNNPLLACGGNTPVGTTQYLLYVNRLTNRPAYEAYSATYLATPTPSYTCGLAVGPTSITTAITTATQVTTTYITQVYTTSFPVTVSNNITIYGESTYTTTVPVTQTQLVGTFTETRTVLETATVTTPYLATITWTTQGSTVTSVVTSSTTYTTVSTRVLRGPPRTVTETFTRDGVVRTRTVTRGPPVISDPPSNPPTGRDCFGPRGCTLSLRFGLLRFPQTEPGEVCSIVTRSWVLGATELLPSATLPAIGEASDAPAGRVAGPDEIEPVIGAVTEEPEAPAEEGDDEPEPEIGSISTDPDTPTDEGPEALPEVGGDLGDNIGDEADVPVGVPIAPVPGDGPAGAEDPEVLPENLPEQL